MTVAELRAALDGVPDDLEVLRRDESFLTWVETASVARVFDDGVTLGAGVIDEAGDPYFVVS